MPITQIASITNLLRSGIASAERVFELLMNPRVPDPLDATVPPPHGPGRLGRPRHLQLLTRHRVDQGPDIGRGPGEAVVIVNAQPAPGKTTLINLLMRFYEIDGGCIRLDGVDTAISPGTTCGVPSGWSCRTPGFPGTIPRTSPTVTDGATEEQIVEAATAAHVDRLVRTLPDGYDTLLGTDAANVNR